MQLLSVLWLLPSLFVALVAVVGSIVWLAIGRRGPAGPMIGAGGMLIGAATAFWTLTDVATMFLPVAVTTAYYDSGAATVLAALVSIATALGVAVIGASALFAEADPE